MKDYKFFICSSLGDLIPRHIQIFSNNQFFRGLQIPEPSRRVSLVKDQLELQAVLILTCIASGFEKFIYFSLLRKPWKKSFLTFHSKQ